MCVFVDDIPAFRLDLEKGLLAQGSERVSQEPNACNCCLRVADWEALLEALDRDLTEGQQAAEGASNPESNRFVRSCGPQSRGLPLLVQSKLWSF